MSKILSGGHWGWSMVHGGDKIIDVLQSTKFNALIAMIEQQVQRVEFNPINTESPPIQGNSFGASFGAC